MVGLINSDKMTENDLKEKLKLLTKIDLSHSDISVDNLKMQIAEIIEPFLIMVIGANFPKIYRCRINEDKKIFSNIKDLWYPRKEKILKLGRFNNIHEQVFYCATNYMVSVLEVNPDAGDVVTIMECELKESERQLKVPNIFLNKFKSIPGISCNVNAIEINNKAQSILNNKENIRKHTLIQKFLEFESVKEVKKGEEHNYKISVAVKEILFTIGELDGLCYPSIVVNKEAVNMALRPKAVDSYYVPTKVWVLEKQMDNNESYLKLINKSIAINTTTGSITYEF
ncbi:hypothetical protein V6C32_10965 [Desulforamulus ruminis]|uniref:hypothetical protein n=1 Tax=Desulforamulus ruminis TaxID=1564 RepID=UPI002FD9DE59